MRTLVKPWLLGTVLAMLPAVASAEEQVKPYTECTRQPTDADVSAAKGAFQAGQVSFNEADYERAIFYWEDAFRRDCTADALLLNLARAYELNGQKRQAVVALETYMARKPDAQQDSIKKRVDALKAQIERESPAQATTTSNTTTTDTTTDADQMQTDTTTTGDAGVTTTSRGGSARWIAAGVMGVGGAMFVIGGIVFLKATSDINGYEEDCEAAGGDGRTGCPDAIVNPANDARSRQKLSGWVSVIGLAIGGAGAYWFFSTAPKSETVATAPPRPRRTTQLAPAVGPGFAGLELSGSF
jgi:hypothetical protein